MISGEFLKRSVFAAPFVIAANIANAAEKPVSLPEKTQSLHLGSYTPPPVGHYEFCKKNYAECHVTNSNVAPLKLTAKIWQKVVAVDARVNRTVLPLSDNEIYGKDEEWAYPEKYGDCEDYALEKQRELVRAGMSVSNLLITVARKSDGEGHAVLTLRTDRGDFILDNLITGPYPVASSDYRILKTQNPRNSGKWVSVGAHFIASPAQRPENTASSGKSLPQTGLY